VVIMCSKAFKNKYPAVCLPHLRKLLHICVSPSGLTEIGVYMLFEMGPSSRNCRGTKPKSKLPVSVFCCLR